MSCSACVPLWPFAGERVGNGKLSLAVLLAGVQMLASFASFDDSLNRCFNYLCTWIMALNLYFCISWYPGSATCISCCHYTGAYHVQASLCLFKLRRDWSQGLLSLLISLDCQAAMNLWFILWFHCFCPNLFAILLSYFMKSYWKAWCY